MRSLIRFTNRFGDVNHGIVLDTDPVTGLLFIQWDEFTALLTRLESRGRVSDFVRAGLSLRQSWVRAPRVGAYGDYSELLPIDAPVEWNCRELRDAQQRAQTAALQVA